MSALLVIATQKNAAPAGRSVAVHVPSGNGMTFDLDPRGS